MSERLPFSAGPLAYSEQDVEFVRDVRARIRDWAASLPDPLHATVRNLSPRHWGDELASVNELIVVDMLPSWLSAYFGVTDPQIIGRAGLAANLMFWYCCLQDARIDRDVTLPESETATDPLGNILFSDSLALFSSIAGDHRFWTHAHEAFVDLAEAYRVEGNYASLPPEQRATAVANRSAPARILVAALAYCTKREDLLADGLQIVHYIVLGCQITDDLRDWKHDLRCSKQSSSLLALTPLMGDAPFSEWREEEVAHALYLYGGLEMLMDQHEHCGRSILSLLENSPSGRRQGLATHAQDVLSELAQMRTALADRKRQALEETLKGASIA